jgi:sugar lactone lactonase YvrE
MESAAMQHKNIYRWNASGERTVKNMMADSRTLFWLLVLCGLLVGTEQARAQATATTQNTIGAGFSSLSGVAADPYGNLYVSDGGASTIYKYIGGNGTKSTIVSSLHTPGQIAVDVSGNLLVANGTSNVAYLYETAQGVFNLNAPTSLGTGLGKVTGVAADTSGNVYIVDQGNQRVVKETLSGTTYTQSVILTGLVTPTQVAVDRHGNVYVADPGQNAVVSLPSGSTTASTVGTGLLAPNGVAVDANSNVYIADTGNSRVVKVPYSTSTSAPVTSSQTALGVSLLSPTSVAVDTRGAVYVTNASSVVRYSQGAIYLGLLQASSATLTVPVNITFTSSLAAATATIKVVTAGQTGKDYTDAGSSTCSTGTTYTSGSSCVVNVTFAPLYPGARPGAIVFYDANNKVQLRVFLGGGGLGPVLTYETGGAATVVAGTLTSGSTSIAMKTPRGIKSDPFGNLFFADTGNGQIVKQATDGTVSVAVASSGIQDVSINGAGDLIAVSTAAATLYPYENGTWSSTDAITLNSASGRTINTDVAGNIWTCNYNLTGTANTFLYRYTLDNGAATSTKLYSGYFGLCFGVAADLLGNLGVSDYTAKDAWYLPATGKTPYKLGINASYPWAVGFDASGSLFMSDYGASATDTATSVVYRVPNEYGTLTGGDVTKLNSGRPSFGFSIDPFGNIMTAMRASGSSTVNHYLIPRAANTITYASATAVGSSGSAAQITIVNSGNQAPTYTQTGGIFETGDADDFPLNATLSSTPSIAQCDFTSTIEPALSCYLATNFVPTSPGATRTATVSLPSQGPSTNTLTLTGTSSGTAASTASGLKLSISSPTGSIYPTQSITVAASAASAATGTVTLYVDGSATAVAALSGGAATFTLSSGLTAGTHTLAATYAGDATYAPIETTSSVTLSLTVVKATPSLTIASGITQATVAQSVPFTATVATASGLSEATGTVTFYDGTTALGSATLSSGALSFSTTALTKGTHTITGVYGGDALYNSGSSSNSVTIVVSDFVETTLSLGLNPTVPEGGYSSGQTVVATATVAAQSGSDVPTGAVIFALDGSAQSVTLSNGIASYSFAPSPGSHALAVSYAGSSNFAGSVAGATFTAVKTSTQTALQVSSTSTQAGVPITLTATVSSAVATPTGTVSFYNGVALLGTATLSSGTASLALSTLPSGTNSLYVVYAGNTDFETSTSATTTVTVSINTTALSISSSPLIVYSGTSLNVIVYVSYTQPSGSSKVPSGKATLYVDGTAYGSISVSAQGNAEFDAVTGLASGVHQLTASYVGDSYYAASATTGNYPIYIAPASGWGGDFAVTASQSALTIATGTTTSLNITLTPSSNYYGYVSLGCTGLPQNTACTLATDQVLLDGSNTAVTEVLKFYSTTSTTSASLRAQNHGTQLCGWLAAPLVGLLFAGCFRRGRRMLHSIGGPRLVAFFLLLAGMQAMNGCGGHPAIQTTKGTYTVQITASGSGSIIHTYPVEVTFQ